MVGSLSRAVSFFTAGSCKENSTRLHSNVSFPLRGGEGVVQICMMGQWRFICDDRWDLNATEIACRELGYPTEGNT